MTSTMQQYARKKPRRQPRHIEAGEQAAVILWARARFESDPRKYHDLDLLHCSLNGVPLTKAQAVRAKAQGMKAGIPDLSLPVPIGKYHGLYIEMKAEKGRESADQKTICRRLAELGYRVVVAYGAEEAKQAIRDYYGEG